MRRQLALAVSSLLFLGAGLLGTGLLAAGCAPSMADGGTELVFAVKGDAPAEADVSRAVEVLTGRLKDLEHRGALVGIAAEEGGEVTLTAMTPKRLELEQATALAALLARPGQLSFTTVAPQGSDPRWVQSLPQHDKDEPLEVMRRLPDAPWFTSADLGRVFPTKDQLGHPAIGFEMTEQSRSAFGVFTGELGEDGRLAIVLDEVVLTAPFVMTPLYGTSYISGGVEGFTDGEVRDMVILMRNGELEPELELLEVRRDGVELTD